MAASGPVLDRHVAVLCPFSLPATRSVQVKPDSREEGRGERGTAEEARARCEHAFSPRAPGQPLRLYLECRAPKPGRPGPASRTACSQVPRGVPSSDEPLRRTSALRRHGPSIVLLALRPLDASRLQVTGEGSGIGFLRWNRKRAAPRTARSLPRNVRVWTRPAPDRYVHLVLRRHRGCGRAIRGPLAEVRIPATESQATPRMIIQDGLGFHEEDTLRCRPPRHGDPVQPDESFPRPGVSSFFLSSGSRHGWRTAMFSTARPRCRIILDNEEKRAPSDRSRGKSKA